MDNMYWHRLKSFAINDLCGRSVLCKTAEQLHKFLYIMDRKPLSKRTRFKIFKRDEFTCMYCWRTPTRHDITLEVDHRISVKHWWWDQEENLITSCFDCNRWKSWDSVIVWNDLQETKIELESIKERLEQIQYIWKLKDKISKKRKEIEENKFLFIDEIMTHYNPDFIKLIKTRIVNQHKKYNHSLDLLEECLLITEQKFTEKWRFHTNDFMKYFHWVLNNKLS